MALLHDASQSPNTIWTPISENRFVRTVQEVQAVFAQVPGEAHIHDQKSGQACFDHVLPYNVEYQLAQDVAFIAAHEEGVHTVSAATVEEKTTEQGLTFTIASNSGVGSSVREGILRIGRCLERCAQKELPRPECTGIVLRSAVQLCEPRIIGRFKCKDWIPPPYQIKVRRPMHEDLDKVFIKYLSKNKMFTGRMKSLISRLRDFLDFMIRVNQPESTITFETRLEALQLAGSVCDVQQSLEIAIDQAAIKVDETSIKAIRAFDKVANYQHLSERLSTLAGSSKFRHLFQSPQFRFLDNYAPHVVLGRNRFVHAEVQIVTFHRLERTQPRPRVIGTTKAACYLCNLFLSLHPQYRVSATHGTLFDAWTIPDILPYSVEDRRELRAIVQNMQLVLEAQVGKRNQLFRPFPVQSGIYHVPSLPSLAGTVIGPTSLAEIASVSTLRSFSKIQDVTERDSIESVGKAASSLATAGQSTCGHRGLTKKINNKGKEFRFQRQVELSHDLKTSGQANCKVVESSPNGQSKTKASLKVGTEEHEVSELEGVFNERNDGESKPPQMCCPSSACIKTLDSRRQQDQQETEGSPHRDRGDGCAHMVYRLGNHAGRLSSASKPAKTQIDASHNLFEEIHQENGKSRKRRRKRRRRVKGHPDRRRNHDVSKQSRDKTYRRHGNRGHAGHASHKKSHYRVSGGRHSFLKSLRRAIRVVHGLFCL